jgi:hypothetical protein
MLPSAGAATKYLAACPLALSDDAFIAMLIEMYEMDPKNNDADLLEMADAMGVSLESARKLYRK